MENMLEYKGYHALVTYYMESNTFRGILKDIIDYVDFETDDSSRIVQEFHSAVDEYLIFCEEVGKELGKQNNE